MSCRVASVLSDETDSYTLDLGSLLEGRNASKMQEHSLSTLFQRISAVYNILTIVNRIQMLYFRHVYWSTSTLFLE